MELIPCHFGIVRCKGIQEDLMRLQKLLHLKIWNIIFEPKIKSLNIILIFYIVITVTKHLHINMKYIYLNTMKRVSKS